MNKSKPNVAGKPAAVVFDIPILNIQKIQDMEKGYYVLLSSSLPLLF